MKLVTIEGIDGSGKSTLFRDLKKVYKQSWLGYVKFPGDYFFQHYNKSLTEDEIELLQNEDKRRIFDNGKKKGLDVLMGDRGEVSQKVYNGTEKTSIESDVIIYLDISIDEAFKRMSVRGIEDNLGYESREVLTEKRKKYKEILNRDYKGKVFWFVVTDSGYKDKEGNIYTQRDLINYLIKEIEILK